MKSCNFSCQIITVLAVIVFLAFPLPLSANQIVFYDDFPSTTLNPANWTITAGAPTIDNVGLSEPSEPYSLRLNGNPTGVDTVESRVIDLSGLSETELTYWYEQTGGGESPDVGDDLFFEYLNAASSWVELTRHLGSGPDMTSYVQIVTLLPSGAYHSGFKLRIRNNGTSGAFDDWFVDDVSIAIPGDINVFPLEDLNSSGNVGGPFVPSSKNYTLTNIGPNSLDWTAAATQSWLDVTPGGGTLVGGASTTVDVIINTVANTLPTGDYNDVVTFTNTTSGVAQTRTVILEVTPMAIACFSMDTDPGWSTQGQWSFGVPLGGGSHCGDPTSGHTGVNVYGYNLAGDYSDNMPEYYLTTTALDCSGFENVRLSFWRWLGIESLPYDQAKVEVSNNGSNWFIVWEHTGGSFCDSAWTERVYDISSVADDQPTVYIRWTMGPTDGSVTYPGWNIDDVCLLGELKDDLNAVPPEDFTSIGYEGGPFVPSSKSYILTNDGPNSLDWTAATTQSWLDVTPAGGTLAGGAFTTVDVIINADANTLVPGDYNDVITFTNTTSGYVQTRGVLLEVIAVPGEIEVTDSILPADDNEMPFGDVFIGLSPTEHVTITNTDPDYELIVTDIFLVGSYNVSSAAVHDRNFGLESEGRQIRQEAMSAGVNIPVGPQKTNMGDERLVIFESHVLTDNPSTGACGSILYAPSESDNPTFRAELSAACDDATVDYFDARVDTPSAALLSTYDCVFTWVNFSYADNVQFGDNLADYVDAGGKVILGQWCYHSDQVNWLAGRVMTSAYCPVTVSTSYAPGSYASDGTDCIHDGVSAYNTSYLDVATLLPGNFSDGTFAPGGSLSVAWRPDRRVYYNAGNTGFVYGSGDWPQLTCNQCCCGEVAVDGFRLENIPDINVPIPPLGSIAFDVIFTPTEFEDYETTVVIKSTDADEPNVVVQLSGRGIAEYLEIVPDANFVFSGHPGGPFMPSNESYQLTNNGPVNIDWTVDEPNWLDVNPSSGTLKPGYSTTVTVTPNSQADAKEEGSYKGQLLFTDITTTVEQIRNVILNVHTAPKIWAKPSSLDITIPYGETATQILTIGNTGDSALNFTLSSKQTNFTPPMGQGSAGTMQQFETSEDTMVLEYEFSKPVITGSEEYNVVQIEGLESYERTGAPIVPVRPVTVLIPFGKEVVATRVELVDTNELQGTYYLPPGQKPYSFSYEGVVEPTEPNSAIYSQTTPWPGMDHEEVMAQSKRGYQLFNVNLFPLQYIPAMGEISYATKVRLEIDLTDAPDLPLLRPSDAAKARLLSTVGNPSMLEDYPKTDTSTEEPAELTSLPPGGPYQYVIVTNEALEAASGPWNFQTLRDVKTAKGMKATIVTTEWVYANYDGTRPDGSTDNQTRIRNFLIDAYQNWGTEYVLLGGTNTIVPARLFWVNSLVGDVDEMPVDMYYGCVEPAGCTFDYDADGLYGEPTDGVGGGEVDLYADIYVGRAPVENAAELQNFIKKTLDYDLTQNEYLSRIAMLGEWLGFGGVAEYAKDSMEQVRLGGNYDGYFTYGFENHLQSNFIDFNTIDCLPAAPTCCWPLYDKDAMWPKSDLTSLMSGGIHIFNHLGHANYTNCMKLHTSDLASLTNTDYFFVYSQGCMPGGFDVMNCFAEVITSMEHGAFAAVMNARYGYGQHNSTDGPSQRFARQFWDAVLGEDMLQIGRANQDSKEDNLWDINGSCIRWIYYELNLFGDPSQQFRFAKSCDWLEFMPDSGTVAPDTVNDVNVIFIAEQPPGTYQGHISILSDDPYTPELTIPVTMTVEAIDYFTELFEPNGNDMANKTLTFRPDASGSYYQLCINEANGFPVDPNGGTVISFEDDDYEQVNLDGAYVNLYGTKYGTFYIGSNGYITFESGDTYYLESFADHFNLPRISALFDDLDPSAGGTISFKQFNDRVVVTFENISEYSLSNSNSFQIEMRFNGKIRITFLEIEAEDGLVGLSEGNDVPVYFIESNLSEYGVCSFLGDLNGDQDVDLTDYAIFASYWQNLYEDTLETVRDEFNAISFGGNDGTQYFSYDWQEIGESDGPDKGRVVVAPAGESNALWLGKKKENRGASREVDLSGSTFATLTFDWQRGGLYSGNDTTVDVSSDGGATWTTLLNIPDGDETSLHSESFDISDYIAPDTQIRFITNKKGDGYIYFDNIQIQYGGGVYEESWCRECDFNPDLGINVDDLLIFVQCWLN